MDYAKGINMWTTGHNIQESIIESIMWSGAALVTIPFVWLIGDLLWNGWTHLTLSFVFSPPYMQAVQEESAPFWFPLAGLSRSV